MTRSTRLVWCVGIVALLGAAACQSEPRERREPTPLDLDAVGTITGTVRLSGPAPARTELNLRSSAECAALHEGTAYADDVLVHDGAVENALVYVRDGLGDRVFAVPEETVVIDQEACLFTPRVAGAQTGQPVRYLNSDKLAHNVHGLPQASRSWNFMLAVKGASRTTTVDAAEAPIEIKCDVHPWMRAYLGVFDHPYFAVTGADGTFTLAQVPPGEYVLAVWHERLGTRTTTVTLEAKGTERVTFTLGE